MPSAKPSGATNVHASGAAKSNAAAAAAAAAETTVETKLVKQSSAEKDPDLIATDPLQQIHILMDKRIRSLEKRKARLETLQEEKKAGKQLIEDQIVALRKYDGVLEMLDFFKEFRKQLEVIYEQHNKALKKAQKKEEAERVAREKEQIRTLLIYQDILTRIGNESFRQDHLKGTNDAVKVESDRLRSLEELSTGVNINLIKRPTYDDRVNKSVDRLVSLIGGKPKPVVKDGASYKDVKDTLDKIHKSGYLNKTSPAIPNTPKTVDSTKPLDLSKKDPTETQPPVSEFVPQVPVSVAPAPVTYPFQDEDPAVVAMVGPPPGSIQSQVYESTYNPMVSTAALSVNVPIMSAGQTNYPQPQVMPLGSFGHFQSGDQQNPPSQDEKTFDANGPNSAPRDKRPGNFRGNYNRPRGGGSRGQERRGDNRPNGYAGNRDRERNQDRDRNQDRERNQDRDRNQDRERNQDRDRNQGRPERYEKGGNMGNFNGTDRRSGDHYRSQSNRSNQKSAYNSGSQNRPGNSMPNASNRQ